MTKVATEWAEQEAAHSERVKERRLVKEREERQFVKTADSDQRSNVRSVEAVQHEIDNASNLLVSKLPQLVCDIAAHKDAAAAVYVYDIMKSKGKDVDVTPAVRAALKSLEADRGKAGPSFTVPAIVESGKRTLQPSRRIHKICKGAKMTKRSVDAAPHVDAAKLWVQSQPPGSINARSCSGRIKTARTLQTFLGVSFETARGLVTSLKRRKVL